MNRAIWSAPPPVAAGTTSVTGLVGSHFWAIAVGARSTNASIRTDKHAQSFMVPLPRLFSYKRGREKSSSTVGRPEKERPEQEDDAESHDTTNQCIGPEDRQAALR